MTSQGNNWKGDEGKIERHEDEAMVFIICSEDITDES